MVRKGPLLWEKAKQLIPGGCQLLSKRSERFLPDLWPAYYSKAKGCEVWDLEGRHYYDFAQMGVGSCILGYSDPDVNRAVIKAIEKSSMCTLNCYEEIELAEKLIALHPWAQMARFARTGGEACSIAVRIARAVTGRNKVAFCGYHGWHDWYLAANIANSENLDGQLLPGLEPKGVPRELKNTAIPFKYNRLVELEQIANKYSNQIGAIIMEPRRESEPIPGFLEGVRKIADKIGAVLIFDEVTSGFRMNIGGIHLISAVMPDIAVFGKALGNGFPISAIIGRREIMRAAEKSFISSTFWTERIGFVAALATINKIERLNTPKYLIHYGERINQGWQSVSRKYKLSIKVCGIPPLTHISFITENPAEVQTLYAQEMLAKGFLLGASVYTSYSYSDKIIDKFIAATDSTFLKIRKALDSGKVSSYLKGGTIQTGFARLTSS